MDAPPRATNRPVEISRVDDQADYVELTRVVFKMSTLAVNLHHAKDGEECMAFNRKQGRYIDAPTPDIILLDLNMPRMGGREVLVEISKDDNLRHLPVIILTSSQDGPEVLKMYQLGCSSYIVKPLDFNELIRSIQSFCNYWLTTVVLPQTL